MMENAIVYLQERGYIPKLSESQRQQTGERSSEEESKILRDRGLLPRK
jgi:hypothetical protein